MANKFKPIVDTHVHSSFSLLDGVSSPTENILRAKEMGSPALAITDHGTMAGIYEFYTAAKKNGIIPLIGCELYLRECIDPESLTTDNHYFHGLFIATNKIGYHNLLRLCSLGDHPDRKYKRKPVVTFEDIFQYSEGLIFSTGCMVGILGTARGQEKGVQRTPLTLNQVDPIIQKFLEVFKGRMFIELGPAAVTHDWKYDIKKNEPRDPSNMDVFEHECHTSCLQEAHNRRGLYIAEKYGIPLLVATDAHMKSPDLKSTQDLLIKSAIGNSSGWHFEQTHALLSSEEMWAEFQVHHPYITRQQFEVGIDNSYKIMDMCKSLELDFDTLIPQFPIETHPLYESDMGKRDLMYTIIKSGGRMQSDPKYMIRLKKEIDVICDNGVTDYTDYFLILSDIARFARENDIGMGPARGSAGGCLLSYVLGITSLDPIKHNLSFERFLNVGRLKAGHPPDIDMDFTNRDPVVDYIFDKYGEDHTALVGAFQTMKTKAALRDIVRHHVNDGILSNSDPIHKICKTVENAPQYFPNEELFLKGFEDDDKGWHPGHLEKNETLNTYLDENPDIKSMLFAILGKPRYATTHAGGVVITPGNIDKSIPTRFYKGKKATQVDYRTLEKIGGMKIDILGVNTLNYIWDTIKLVKERKPEVGDLNPWDLPNDLDTFEMLKNGDTATVFQFDTDTVRPFLKMGPKSVDDLTLITSIARPGGLDSKMEDGKPVAVHFMRRFKGQEDPDIIDPMLNDILKETYGLVIFQEQIQKIFEVVGGLTPEESDDARRAVGKKDLQVLLSIKGQLMDNAIKKLGWPLEKADALWNSFVGAANYAFNRSHAVAYAIIAYACAYLKNKFPLEWWCSVLTYTTEDTKIKELLPIVRNLVRMPNVNAPASRWEIRKDIEGKEALFAPVSLIRGIGDSALGELNTKAPFATLEDFVMRVSQTKVNKTAILNLIASGCFSDFGGDEDISGMVDEFMELRAKKGKKKKVERPPAAYEGLSDRIKRSMLKAELLPIVSCNYVQEFLDVIVANKKHYRGIDEKRFSGTKYPVVQHPRFGLTPLIVDLSKLDEAAHDWSLHLEKAKDNVVAILAMVTECKDWNYTVKKTGEAKKGAKLFVENDRQQVRMTIWPNNAEKVKKMCKPGNLMWIYGRLRPNAYYSNTIELTFKDCDVFFGR